MKPTAALHWNADRLDVRAFAQAGASLSATDAMARFARLSAEMPSEGEATGWSVRWTAQGEMRAGLRSTEAAVWLHLVVQTELPLTCQRCLTPVPMPLAVDRWFRFVDDEAMAATEDEDCEEDVLSLEPRPNLHELMEDELLMALPLVPMHETCPLTLVMSVGDATESSDAGEQPQRHPFAALAKLKK